MTSNPFQYITKPKAHEWAIILSEGRVTLATFESFDVALSKLDIYGEAGTVEVVPRSQVKP